MLTIFASPKPFTDPHIAVIQRNAITSWTVLRPRPEIILFGDETGAEDICRELGLTHVPLVARNEFGTPLVNDVFEKAQRLATSDLLCYVNADIILTSGFIQALSRLATWRRPLLAIGGRWEAAIREPWDFAAPAWEQALSALVHQQPAPMDWGTDYFVFSRGLYQDLPPLALGRTVWDNWLLWHAHASGASVISLTDTYRVIHQSHCTGANWSEICSTPEAERNRMMTTSWARSFTPADAHYELTATGVRSRRLQRYRHRLRVCFTHTTSGMKSYLHRWGFRRSALQRFGRLLKRQIGTPWLLQ